MSWQQAARDSTGSGLFEDGLSGGMIVLCVLGFLAVVAVCGFGVLARLRDRASDRRSLEAFRAEQAAAAAGSSAAEPAAVEAPDRDGPPVR